jgi:hypothetical protein
MSDHTISVISLWVAVIGVAVAVGQLLIAWLSMPSASRTAVERGVSRRVKPRSPGRLVASAFVFFLVAVLSLTVWQRYRTPPGPTPSTASTVSPSSSAPPSLPGKSFALYDVNSDSSQGAYTVQVDATGSIEQDLPFKADVEVLELGVIIGYEPNVNPPRGPILIELLEDGVPRAQQKAKIKNNQRTSIYPNPHFRLREGRKYTLRVSNETHERMGYYVKRVRSRLSTRVRGSLSGPDGELANVDLSAYVLVREL